MRPKLITLALALVLSAGIAACGEDDEPASGGGAESAAPPSWVPRYRSVSSCRRRSGFH